MPQGKVYLNEQGEPIGEATGQYLDEQGNPTKAPASGNFSSPRATENPDPLARVKAEGEGLMAADDRPHQEPTPGWEGFTKGLSGNSNVGVSLGDIKDKGLVHAAGDFFSAENAGAMTRDAGMMAGGLLIPGALKGGGRAAEATGNALGGRHGSLAMRVIAGHEMGGSKGAVAAAVLPPVLKGFGRVMQRTGAAMSGGPEPTPSTSTAPAATGASMPAPRPTPAPTPEVATPPSVLGRDPGFTRAPAPPLSSPEPAHAPQGRASAQPNARPEPMPPPSLEAEKQTAMLDQLSGPAPLGSLPAGQTPRVKAWKPGFGPSAGDAETMRNAFGAKTAAQLLKTRQDQVTAIAPRAGPATALPTQTSQGIGEQFLAADPATRQQMIDQAPNPLVKQLLQSLNVGPP